MKQMRTLIGILAGVLTGVAAHAQVDLTLTGSTAFRSIVIDRTASLYDAGFVSITNDTSSPNYITYRGTMTGKIPSLGTTPVTMRLSFSGSGSGMLAVRNLTPVQTAETPGAYTNKVPDLAFSDIFPASATPPIPESSFERSVLGVIPFVFVCNNGLTGVNGLTRDQVYLLLTASGTIGGIQGMPASFLGGSSSAPLYFIGRDPGSGTRITVQKVVGFNGTPTLWATNGTGSYVLTNGYSSGSSVRKVVAGQADAIAYLGLADYASINTTAKSLAYNGVAYSERTVATGSYAMWGYEHMVNRAGGLSANQTAVRNALIGAITDPTYQATAIYANSFVRLDQMEVERGTDGGPITSLNF
jgi:hypothetical protein